MIKRIIKIVLLTLFIAVFAVFAYYFRYRFIPFVSVEKTEDLSFKNIEGYTNKLSYKLKDTVYVSINAKNRGKGYIHKLGQSENIIDSFLIQQNKQIVADSMSEFGCNWDTTNTFVIDSNFSPGYYSINFVSDTDTSISNFIIENHSNSKIAILSPISTWVAYNDWGGKSLYRNYLEPKTVYYVSTQRPFSNSINKAEFNLANFFLDRYDATLIPDFYLESNVGLFKNYDIIILAYHCEYFSEKMYENLSYLVEEKDKSLISLGGNQIYWKTMWNEDYTVMECQKDLTSFDHSIFDYGGMWRHHLNKSEHRLLGVRFTDAGMDTYAPYKVEAPNHWIYEGLDVEKGSIFGEYGINNRPISGDETDKVESKNSNMTILAKGLNEQRNERSDAGADFVIIENKKNKILSTSSIESGAGLGVDSVFTKMITNFISKTRSTKQ